MGSAEVEAAAMEAVVPLPWLSRISAMPYLPGGGAQQVENLRQLLGEVDRTRGAASEKVDFGDGTTRTLRDAVKQIAPAGLVEFIDRDHVAVSEESLTWLASDRAYDLIALLHRHVRFVGELLSQLVDGPVTMRELHETANEQFGLTWQTRDQVRRRVTWFTALEVTEYKTSTHVGLTELGRSLVPLLIAGGPDRLPDAPEFADAIIPELPPAIAEVIRDLTEDRLARRNPALGYIPRGNGDTDVVSALNTLVNACVPRISRADFLAYAKQEFDVSDSSFGAMLTTLTKSGLVEQTGFNVYSPTAPASAWLEDPSAANLALLLHARFLFVLEIIPLLSEFDRAADLARAAHEHFGLKRVDVGGVRTRLQILKAAGLVYERANWRYQATPLGENFAYTFPSQSPAEDDEPFPAEAVDLAGEATSERRTRLTDLTEELQSSALDSEVPVRLERAVSDAFSALGFESRHLGGGGKTDVLATVSDEAGSDVVVMIDAKAARSGEVGENSVHFDTLREHKKRHEADHVVLVGPSFNSGRTRQRAGEQDVRLLPVAELVDVLRQHEQTPLSASEYIDFVSPAAERRQMFESARARAERRIALLGHVVAVLAEESRQRDEITGGALTIDQIYLIVRDEVDPRPSSANIEDVLRLLEHPLVGAVRRSPTSQKTVTYQLQDSPSLVASKIRILAGAVATVAE